MLIAAPASAQDRSTVPELEDLIPDSAIANPDAWAQQGQPADAEAEPMVPVDPESPLAEVPTIDVPWPDNIELPQLAPLEPDDSVQFADLEDAGDPAPALAEAEVIRVTDELVLAFPTDDAAFPDRQAFADRFGTLSTISELDTDDDNVAQLAARARADQTLLESMLRVYGYYDGQVLRSVAGLQAGEESASTRPEVRFDVIPGPRYRFGAVDHARTEGDLTLPVRPGGKYVFGEVVSNRPNFLSGKHLASIARFDPGDTYQRSLEFDLRRAIVSTGLVSSVTVKPREVTAPNGDKPGVVALDVEMRKAKLRTIAGAIGYGTGEGFRAEASWEHRNLFPPEGMLRVRGIAGTQEQLLGVTYRKNNLGGRDKVLTVDAFASTIDSQAYDARTVSLIGTYERLSTLLFQKPLSYSVGLEAVATRERPAPVSGVAQPLRTFFVGAIPLYAQLDTTDNLLDPKKGFRAGVRLSPEVSRSNRTQSFYLRGQFDGSTYRRVTDSIVVAARVRFGAIPGTALDNIAPSRRLYSGGGGSVRGYGYQAIGPRDANGNPTGGRSLLEGAVEARIGTKFFDGALSVVPFVDAGTVGPDVLPDFDTVRIGAGVGVRYNTGFGPLRFDIATPINPGPGDSRVAVYVSLGQAF